MNIFKWFFGLFKKKEPNKEAINKPLKEQKFSGAIRLLDANRTVNEIIVHCAATREGQKFTTDNIRDWHLQRGWNDIGYHYVVELDGSVHAGRPVSKIGAHVKGHNTGSIGISYVGGMDRANKRAKDTRTPDQREALLWLVKSLAEKYKVKKIAGHNQYSAKACPSFDVRKDELGNIPGYRAGTRTKK